MEVQVLHLVNDDDSIVEGGTTEEGGGPELDGLLVLQVVVET